MAGNVRTELHIDSGVITADYVEHKRIELPENATLKQIREFNAVVAGIVIDIDDLIEPAFERIFNEPYDKEDGPNELEGSIE